MEMRISNEGVEIDGYVNAVGRDSAPLRDAEGYFVEQVEPGAFARALSANPNVPMLLNHDASRVLAKGDDLSLREDAVGLHAHAFVRDTDVVQKAKEGRLRGWSFGFAKPEQVMGERDGLRHRTLTGFELREVSLIDDRKRPAYPATSVYSRDAEGNTVEVRFIEDVAEVREEPQPTSAPDLSEWTERIAALGILE